MKIAVALSRRPSKGDHKVSVDYANDILFGQLPSNLRISTILSKFFFRFIANGKRLVRIRNSFEAFMELMEFI